MKLLEFMSYIVFTAWLNMNSFLINIQLCLTPFGACSILSTVRNYEPVSYKNQPTVGLQAVWLSTIDRWRFGTDSPVVNGLVFMQLLQTDLSKLILDNGSQFGP